MTRHRRGASDGAPDSHQDNQASTERTRFRLTFLVPKSDLDDFIARTAPLYSQSKLVRFAGVIMGQLQYRKELTYAQRRRLLEKVRNVITQSALTDGWGHTPPGNL